MRKDGTLLEFIEIASKRTKANRLYSRQMYHQKYKYNPELIRRRKIYDRNRTRELKLRVIAHYSNGTNRCACCGESTLMFLTIDHINNDGAKERAKFSRSVRRGLGSTFHKRLIENNFPLGYQILCYNCNCGRAKNGGICPHKEVKEIQNGK